MSAEKWASMADSKPGSSTLKLNQSELPKVDEEFEAIMEGTGISQGLCWR